MAQTDSLAAISSFVEEATMNPFFEPGVYEAVKYLNGLNGGEGQAYDLVLNAVNMNPFSTGLNKAYALQCVRVGLRSYAMDVREE